MFELCILLAAAVFSPIPLQESHRIECALARGSAAAPAAEFPLEVTDAPRAFWWDDAAFHAGKESYAWQALGCRPVDGAEFRLTLKSDRGIDVDFRCQLKESAATYRVPTIGILGNRTVTNTVTFVARKAGRVRRFWNAVGPRSPRFIRDVTRPIRAGETLPVPINGRAVDSGNLIFNLYDSDGRILFMAFYPFHDPAVKFAYRVITSDPEKDILHLQADQWFAKGERRFLTMRMEDLRTGVDSGWTATVPLREETGVFQNAVDVSKLKPGVYRAWYEVTDPAGARLHRDYAFYAKEDGRWPWDGTTYGAEDTVPPPWTKPAFGPDGFTCWNRSVRLGGEGLVTSIVSGGREFLSAPVTLVRNGRPLTFDVERRETKVSTAAYRLRAREADVAVDVTCEFDGFMWFDVTHRGEATLELRVPARRDRVVGFDDCSSPIEKLALPKGKTADVAYDPETRHWWWFGAETGLMGGIQSLRGWRLRDRARGNRFVAGDREAVMTVRFVDTPAADGRVRTLGFYLQPTPVKPKNVAFALQKRASLCTWTDHQEEFFDMKIPGWFHEDEMAPYLELQKKGKRVFWYNGTKGTSPLSPWWGRLGQDWYDSGDPAFFAEENVPKSRRHRERGVWVTACLNSKTFFDHKLWGIGEFLANPKYGAKDLYFDLACQHRCMNRQHGCTWTDEFGKICRDSDFRRVRELHKRVYRLLKAKNPEGAMIGHLQYQRTPSDVFFDRVLMGETYDRFIRSTMSYYDVLNPEMMQIQYASRAAELVVDMLPQVDRAMGMFAPDKVASYDPHAPENDRVIRHATAYFKIHDLEVMPQGRGATQWSAPDAALASFGTARTHAAYYNADCPVSVGRADPRFLYAIYAGNGRKLLILLNDTDRTVAERVSVRGLSGIGADIFGHGAFDFTAGSADVELAPRESLFILFK